VKNRITHLTQPGRDERAYAGWHERIQLDLQEGRGLAGYKITAALNSEGTSVRLDVINPAGVRWWHTAHL
jgi:hypothetical protein